MKNNPHGMKNIEYLNMAHKQQQNGKQIEKSIKIFKLIYLVLYQNLDHCHKY